MKLYRDHKGGYAETNASKIVDGKRQAQLVLIERISGPGKAFIHNGVLKGHAEDIGFRSQMSKAGGRFETQYNYCVVYNFENRNLELIPFGVEVEPVELTIHIHRQ